MTTRARAAFADGIAAQGPSWAKLADSIRSGFTNIWIAGGIAALEAVIDLLPREDSDDS